MRTKILLNQWIQVMLDQRQGLARGCVLFAAVACLHVCTAALATRRRNTCRTKTGKNSYTFDRLTEPTQLQAKAFELIAACAQ